jgi:ATP-binding cassette, subfamily B, bacterial
MSNIAKAFEPQLPRRTNAIISCPCEKCGLARMQTKSRVASLLDLAAFLAPYRARWTLALCALMIAAGATLAMPVAFRYLIDLGFAQANRGHINTYFLALFAVAAVLAVGTAARFYLVSWLGERVAADIRRSTYAHVLRMSPSYFETLQTGEVLSRLTADTTLIETLVGTSISMGLRNALLLTGGLLMLAVTSARLTLYIVLLMLFVVLPIIVFGRRVRKLSRASQDRVAATSAFAGETLNAVQTVQVFTAEARETERFADAVMRAFGAAVDRIRARALLTAVVILLVFGAIVLVLWLGAQAVLAGEMTAGQLGQFILYAVVVAGSVGAVAEVWGDVQRAAGATERLMQLMSLQSEIRDPSNPRPIPEAGTGVELSAVTFHYPSRPAQPALQDINLHVRPGEHVALVGPSGAGKSTIFQLLLRFYDPQQGNIRLNGVELRDARLQDLRGKIGIVPQDTVIFGASALENIRYGRADASDAEVVEAAKAAAAHEFIEHLPERYQTFLGEKGVRLSGGQRQRIAIARAILKNPPILLLDEATSALDAESELLVQQALERAAAQRTTLVIAHRLATVKQADRIVVLDQGRIVAMGTHAQLLETSALYARLAQLQFGSQSPPQ